MNVTLTDAPNVSDIISDNAANIPPRAWPLTTAVMYSEGNKPDIPNNPPDRIAVATKKRLKVYKTSLTSQISL